MYVADVASAVVAALKDDGSSMGKLYELGGPDIYTQRELVNLSSLSFPYFVATLVLPVLLKATSFYLNKKFLYHSFPG